MVGKVQHHYELVFPKDKETENSNPEMTLLLNNLDKLEAADNNTKEPDPTNMVDEDKMVTLVDILIHKKASRDNKILRSGTRQSFKDSVGLNYFLVKELENNDDVFAAEPFIASVLSFS